MSRKKRRIIGASRRTLPSAGFLRELMSETGLSKIPGLWDHVFAGSSSTGRLDTWLESLDDILSMYPAGYRFDFNKMKKLDFQLTGLYREMFAGKCRDEDGEHQIYVLNDNATPAGCSCAESKGEFPCEHSYHFVNWLMIQIRNRESKIAQRILRQNFDQPQPRLDDFKPNLVQSFRNHLESLFSDLEDVQPFGDSQVAFPGQRESEKGRIAWDFTYSKGQLSVACFHQTPRKKGAGFNKGRKISLSRIGEFQPILSPADRRIQAKINSSPKHPYYAFDSHLAVSAYDAAFELLGQKNVLVEGQPGTIKTVEPIVRYRESATHCWLQVGKGKTRRLLHEDRYFEVSQKSRTIGIAQLTRSQSKCVRALFNLGQLPKEVKSELLDQAQILRKVLTVRLPEDVDGKLVDESTIPVLIVRLAPDGSMNYVWRVKLESGQLASAGERPLIRTGSQDGQPIQMRRSRRSELLKQRQLARFLQLPPGKDSGAISDFESVLKLLQRIRSLSTPKSLEDAQSDVVKAELLDSTPLQQEDLPRLEVLWDEKSEKPVRLLGPVTPQNLRVGISKSRDWFQLSGECHFGDQQVDFATLLHSLRNLDHSSIRGNYVKLGDQGWARISDNLRRQLQRLGDSVNEERKQIVFDSSSAKVVSELLNHSIQVEATKAWADCLNRMEKAQLLKPVVPDNLRAELREYQQDGFCWMRRLAEWGVGGILADDMGLGKTLQALAVVLDRVREGPCLVIAPTSIGFNWVREANRFAPDLKAHLYRETDRDDFLSTVGNGDLVICSYGLALRDAEKLSSVEWGTLILDEAQAVKNARSKTAMAVAGIQAKWKLALTGTPVENHLGELWSLFRAVAPGVFGGWEQFRKRYAGPIEKDQDEDRRLALRDRLQPFILRRAKGEVLKDLPARTESNLVVELSPDERDAYDRVRLSAIGELDTIAKLDDIQDQRFRMLALLTRLRQLACSPRLVHPDWQGRSSKLQYLADTLKELKSEGHRCLVFSQFVSHLQLIREMMDEEKVTYQYLDGSTSPSQRQQRVDAFQNGAGDAFLISLKAGGTGLNLTAADYVVHMDPWWNPAVEDQATDRAHRIGQVKPVMVYRMISQGTIEEEILKLHESKRDLIAGVIDGSSAAAKLSTQDLMNLIRG